MVDENDGAEFAGGKALSPVGFYICFRRDLEWRM